MPHLAPLNWPLIFLIANLQLAASFTLLWWTFYPSYQAPMTPPLMSSLKLPFIL